MRKLITESWWNRNKWDVAFAGIYLVFIGCIACFPYIYRFLERAFDN